MLGAVWHFISFVNEWICVIRATANIYALHYRFRKIGLPSKESTALPDDSTHCIFIAWTDSSEDVILPVPCRFRKEEKEPRTELSENEKPWFEYYEGKVKAHNGSPLGDYDRELEEVIVARMRYEFWKRKPWWKRSIPFLDILYVKEVDVHFHTTPTIKDGKLLRNFEMSDIDTAAIASTARDDVDRFKFGDERENPDEPSRYAHLEGDPDAILAAINADSAARVNASFKLAMLDSPQLLHALREPSQRLSYGFTEGVISKVDGYPGLVYSLSTAHGENERKILPHDGYQQFRTVHVKLGIPLPAIIPWTYDLVSNLLFLILAFNLIESGWWLGKVSAILTVFLSFQWMSQSAANLLLVQQRKRAAAAVAAMQ